MSEAEKEILSTLKEILKWTRFSGWNNVKNVLLSELDSDQKKIVYHLSDGKKGIREIIDPSGAGFGTIQGWWKRWQKMGIAYPISAGSGSRSVASFLLDDFGIQVPDVNNKKTEIKEGKPENVQQ